jgi:hypothetical protein
VMVHPHDFALASGDRLQDVAEIILRHFDVEVFDRSSNAPFSSR